MIKKKLIIFLFLTMIFSVSTVQSLNPNFIITDNEFLDTTTMNQYDIYLFLRRKKSYLTAYKPSGMMYASFYIHDAAQKYGINPQVLLTLLQKEQSLIENSRPTIYNLDWAMGYGMCDSCTRETNGINQFKGFENQVYQSAKRLKEYYDNPWKFNYQFDKTYTIDNTLVKIENRATAPFYNYTPHIHGNENFQKIWHRWFIKNIPNDSIVKTSNDPTIWLIRYGKKHHIVSMSLLKSKYLNQPIHEISSDDLEKYDIGNKIRFHPYSLLVTPNQTIYLLSDYDEIRPIQSNEVFKKLGYNPEELIEISNEDRDSFVQGEMITLTSAYPTGAILSSGKNAKIRYYVNGDIKYPIKNESIRKNNFPKTPTYMVTSQELNAYKLGEPILFIDGSLIKTPTSETVYLIDEGQRRPIVSGMIFEKLGYEWKNIISVDNETILLHTLGKAIDDSNTVDYTSDTDPINKNSL